jgi:hypothetical protein
MRCWPPAQADLAVYFKSLPSATHRGWYCVIESFEDVMLRILNAWRRLGLELRNIVNEISYGLYENSKIECGARVFYLALLCQSRCIGHHIKELRDARELPSVIEKYILAFAKKSFRIVNACSCRKSERRARQEQDEFNEWYTLVSHFAPCRVPMSNFPEIYHVFDKFLESVTTDVEDVSELHDKLRNAFDSVHSRKRFRDEENEEERDEENKHDEDRNEAERSEAKGNEAKNKDRELFVPYFDEFGPREDVFVAFLRGYDFGVLSAALLGVQLTLRCKQNYFKEDVKYRPHKFAESLGLRLLECRWSEDRSPEEKNHEKNPYVTLNFPMHFIHPPGELVICTLRLDEQTVDVWLETPVVYWLFYADPAARTRLAALAGMSSREGLADDRIADLTAEAPLESLEDRED